MTVTSRSQDSDESHQPALYPNVGTIGGHMSSLLGITLSGRYRLEERIGAGGMSTVYRATDETLQRAVAVKVMNREVADDSDQLERFRREARAVAQLSHPNIVGVIDAGDDGGRPYIVFEFIEGETLKQRIRRLGQLPIPEAVAYAIEVARALGAAHARHIVHRDVKPQNVLIDEEGKAKVTDFGIARSLEEEGLTDDGRVVGTTDYVSPEQALGQPVTGQSDLYSLGIVLYEMLAGELPYSGETQVAVAMKHVREPLPDIREKRPEVSAGLAAIVETATAKRLGDRYADDIELISDLEELLAVEARRAGNLDGEATTVMRSLPRRTRRRIPIGIRHRRASLAGAILALVAVAAVAVWLVTDNARSGTGLRHDGGNLVKVHLCGAACVSAYNPDGFGGDTSQDNYQAPWAIDGNPATAWSTENYYSGTLGKPGVGLYLTAPSRIVARRLDILTATPNFDAKIYGSNTPPRAGSFNDSGWVLLHGAERIARQTKVPLPGRRPYRYFLVWITQLPPGQQHASLNELTLYR